MEEIKVSEMLQADSIEKDNAVMIIQDGVNKKASGSIQTATGTSLSLTSVADTCKVTSNSKNMFDESIINNKWIGSAGDIVTQNGGSIQKYLCSEGDTYTLSATYDVSHVDNIIGIAFYSEDGTLLRRTANNTTLVITEIAPANTAYMFAGHYYKIPKTMQLEEGSTSTSYNPYNTEVGIAVKELQLEDGSIQGSDGTPVDTQNRRRTVNFIEIDATKQHIITTGSYQLSVYQYKADGTYLESSQGWQNSPYTLTPNAQTGKIKIVIPNSNAKVYDISIDDIKPQVITLTPNETKSAFTYDTETIVEANGSVTIEYNTQSRLLNNDDVLDIVEPVKEYVDEAEKAKEYTDEKFAEFALHQFRLVGASSGTGASGSFSFTDDNISKKAYLIFVSKGSTDGTYCDVFFIRFGARAIVRLGGTGTGTATATISGNTMTISGLGTYSYTTIYQVMQQDIA